tara:strand:- start:44739 stop:45086 length:348 start_codon:yes stop_codon:yes gene_type:complete
MIGHDVVPHSDEIHSNDMTNTLSSNVQLEHSHSDLGHIFSHFQHPSNNKNLIYLSVDTKVLNHKTESLPNVFFIGEIENQELWYINLEKQRFRDYLETPYCTKLLSHSLRGPPIC